MSATARTSRPRWPGTPAVSSGVLGAVNQAPVIAFIVPSYGADGSGQRRGRQRHPARAGQRSGREPPVRRRRGRGHRRPGRPIDRGATPGRRSGAGRRRLPARGHRRTMQTAGSCLGHRPVRGTPTRCSATRTSRAPAGSSSSSGRRRRRSAPDRGIRAPARRHPRRARRSRSACSCGRRAGSTRPCRSSRSPTRPSGRPGWSSRRRSPSSRSGRCSATRSWASCRTSCGRP